MRSVPPQKAVFHTLLTHLPHAAQSVRASSSVCALTALRDVAYRGARPGRPQNKRRMRKCVYLFFRPKPFPRPGNVYPSPSPFSKVRELLFDEKKDGSGGDGTISINRTFHPVCKAFSIQATPSWRKRLTHTHSLLRSRGLLRDDAAMDCEIFTDWLTDRPTDRATDRPQHHDATTSMKPRTRDDNDELMKIMLFVSRKKVARRCVPAMCKVSGASGENFRFRLDSAKHSLQGKEDAPA